MEAATNESFEDYKARVNMMSAEDKAVEATNLSMVWDMDWWFFDTVYFNQGLTSEEIAVKKKEYYDNCRKRLLEVFGETGIL